MERKQATNFCDCKQGTRELTRYCSAMNTTAYSVSWWQELRDVILNTIRTPSLAALCTLERRPSCEGSTLRPMSESENLDIEILQPHAIPVKD